jgi:hypothetical protein
MYVISCTHYNQLLLRVSLYKIFYPCCCLQVCWRETTRYTAEMMIMMQSCEQSFYFSLFLAVSLIHSSVEQLFIYLLLFKYLSEKL